MDLQDKILATVLETQEGVRNLDNRISKMEHTQERVYDKLDGFMTLISRHEAEIAAVRSKLERLEDRIMQLEAVRS